MADLGDGGRKFTGKTFNLSDGVQEAVARDNVVHRDPPVLELHVTERDSTIELTGAGFTPNFPVHVAFIWGPDEWSGPVLADSEGRIFHSHSDTVAGTCLVTGRDESTKQFTATRSERRRPRLGNEPVVLDEGTALIPADG
jgi:hypothetical protein